MRIEEELSHFVQGINFLKPMIIDLAKVDENTATSKDKFFAEAVAFRLFRNYERLLRAVFLDSCSRDTTLSGQPITSKLKCPDWETAEEILKSGNRFLDWGNIENTKRNASLIFNNGFPVSDLVAPVYSNLFDLQRVRNFIAHDSAEAIRGLEKIKPNYLPAGRAMPSTAGEFLISRRRASEAQVVKKLWKKVAALETIFKEL